MLVLARFKDPQDRSHRRPPWQALRCWTVLDGLTGRWLGGILLVVILAVVGMLASLAPKLSSMALPSRAARG